LEQLTGLISDKERKIKKMVKFEHKRLELRNESYKLVETDDLIIMKDASFGQEVKDVSNFIYAFGLPYDLN
jgi:hypothetical protein